MVGKIKIINLFGGPGSGKSTAAAGLFYRMKMHGYKVELVTEYAKDLVYAGHLRTMLDLQEYIFAEQNWRLQRLVNHVDWAITDSPVLLSAVYPHLNQKLHRTSNWPALPQFIELVKAQFECYNNINIVLKRPVKYQQWGREQSKEEAHEIDDMINDVLLSGNYDFITLETGPLLVEEVLEYLETHHGL